MARKDPLEISNARFTELILAVRLLADKLPRDHEADVLLGRVAKVLADTSYDNGYSPKTYAEYMKENV